LNSNNSKLEDAPMGHPFFMGRKAGKAIKAGKENKGTTLYALPRSADAYDEPIFRHTKGEVQHNQGSKAVWQELFLGKASPVVRSILGRM
jgi:hypothetical protein